MTFDESKHKRGGQGTQQGGQFVSQGGTGTPTNDAPVEVSSQKGERGAVGGEMLPSRGGAQPVTDSEAAAKQLKREAKIARILAGPMQYQPGLVDTPEKKAAYIAKTEAALDEQDAKRAWKQQDKQTKILLSAANQEQDPARSFRCASALHQAVIDSLQRTIDLTEKHTDALNALVDKQEAFWKIAKT